MVASLAPLPGAPGIRKGAPQLAARMPKNANIGRHETPSKHPRNVLVVYNGDSAPVCRQGRWAVGRKGTRLIILLDGHDRPPRSACRSRPTYTIDHPKRA